MRLDNLFNIVFEGMDGSGKETQSLLTQKNLNALGYNYIHVTAPDYELFSGKLVREYLRGSVKRGVTFDEIKDDSIVYSVNRFEHFTSRKLFDTVNRIVYDRWTTSNMLFQTLNMNSVDKMKYVQWLEHLEYIKLRLPSPDIVFVLRCSEKLSYENIKKRGKETDFFENVQMQRRVRENIDFFVAHRGWIPIDVDVDGKMRSREDIQAEILLKLGVKKEWVESSLTEGNLV